jgi:hypothetical protein
MLVLALEHYPDGATDVELRDMAGGRRRRGGIRTHEQVAPLTVFKADCGGFPTRDVELERASDLRFRVSSVPLDPPCFPANCGPMWPHSALSKGHQSNEPFANGLYGPLAPANGGVRLPLYACDQQFSTQRLCSTVG